MKKFKSLMAFCLTASMFFTACQSNTANNSETSNDVKSNTQQSQTSSADTIKLGALGPLTGDVAIYGVTATNGAKLAVEEINKNGGIDGKQIEFILEDEKGDTTEATNAYTKLQGEGIVGLIGDITSKPTVAVAELANEDKVPMITPTGTQFNITEGKEFVYRVCFTDPFQGEVLAQYAADDMKVKKVAILTNNSSDYSQGVAKSFKDEAEKLGLEIVAEESYGDADTDFSAQLTNIAKADPEVLMVPDYYQKIALLAPQAKSAGIEAKFIGPDGWDGVIEQLKGDTSTVDGALFTNHYSLDDKSDKVQNFVNSYKDEYGENPSSFSALSYDAVYMMKQAIEEAGSTDPQAISDKLANIDFEGVTGKLKFDENHNPIKSVSIIKIDGDKYSLDTVKDVK
ncbi:MAG: ABC transporter substrate-binding protein [Peptoniphilaceae bacterium]|nr:ABC transporter substrate-binding protein [Peptoniphilaceae bacterium]MDD7382775.1 ABC transporter substrate-binding protein [Peptoniphilaceae bacterium]MDY3737931.1 ABC transporter substrate-binding protein [Peptoniphilaceae bacterium]